MDFCAFGLNALWFGEGICLYFRAVKSKFWVDFLDLVVFLLSSVGCFYIEAESSFAQNVLPPGTSHPCCKLFCESGVRGSLKKYTHTLYAHWTVQDDSERELMDTPSQTRSTVYWLNELFRPIGSPTHIHSLQTDLLIIHAVIHRLVKYAHGSRGRDWNKSLARGFDHSRLFPAMINETSPRCSFRRFRGS